MLENPIAEWNAQLQKCLQDVERKRVRERQWAGLQADMVEQRKITEDRCRILQKEKEEAEQLAASTFSQFWLKLFGKWDEKLGDEEKGAAEAKLKYDAAFAQLKRMEKEREDLLSDLAELADSENRLDTLRKAKETWIYEHDRAVAAELEKLSERMGEIQALLMEFGEAERAGEQAKEALLRAEDRLESAKNWGTYDLIGGGMISTMVKRGRMDEASDHIHDAQHYLRRFAAELKDTRVSSGVEVPQIGSFLSFADFFFDGFISDWMVQGKIGDSIDSVRSNLDKVSDALRQLRLSRKKLETEAEACRSGFGSLVEQYGA